MGARPQFIKAAAISHLLRTGHREILLHTGQHYDQAMSDQFFRELGLPKPEIEIGAGSGLHGAQTAKMLIGIEQAIAEHRPDAVLVYGDTNSTIAGALAAAKANRPLAHVEAGVRSFNRRMPEEVNRVITDRLSTLLFCPSATAVDNLSREGIRNGVHRVGDVMWDVLTRFGNPADDAAVLGKYGVTRHSYGLVTIHRAENTDVAERFADILRGLAAVPMPLVLPAHPRLRSLLAGATVPRNISVTAPATYHEMSALTRNAHVVVTDSGGLQKESYWLATPCVTVRQETEWPETIEAGWNVLAEPDDIATAVAASSRPTSRPPLYGEGGAAAAIVNHLNDVSRSMVPA